MYLVLQFHNKKSNSNKIKDSNHHSLLLSNSQHKLIWFPLDSIQGLVAVFVAWFHYLRSMQSNQPSKLYVSFNYPIRSSSPLINVLLLTIHFYLESYLDFEQKTQNGTW
jgi:hypothetical protein